MAKRPELPAFAPTPSHRPEDVARFVSTGEVKNRGPKKRLEVWISQEDHNELFDLVADIRRARGGGRYFLQDATLEGLKLWKAKARETLAAQPPKPSRVP